MFMATMSAPFWCNVDYPCHAISFLGIIFKLPVAHHVSVHMSLSSGFIFVIIAIMKFSCESVSLSPADKHNGNPAPLSN